VAGKPVKDGRELQQVVAALPLHKPVEVTVVRDGKPQTVRVTVEEQPLEFSNARPVPSRVPRRNSNSKDTISLDKVGLEITDLTPEMAEQLRYKDGAKGALITQVEAGSLADAAELDRGLLIVKVDKQSVKSAKEAQELIEKGSLDKGVLLQVQTPRGTTNYVVLRANSGK